MPRLRFFFLLILLFGCDSRHPPGFIVLPQAEGMKTFYVRGVDKAVYRIQADFPADKVLKEISDRLQQQGWKPRDTLFLYPEIPTGTKQGWTFYEQSKNNRGWMVYEWSTDFQDKDGNIAGYALQYRDPILKYRKGTFVMRPGNTDLVVNFVYMPKEVAIQLRESMKPKK